MRGDRQEVIPFAITCGNEGTFYQVRTSALRLQMPEMRCVAPDEAAGFPDDPGNQFIGGQMKTHHGAIVINSISQKAYLVTCNNAK